MKQKWFAPTSLIFVNRFGEREREIQRETERERHRERGRDREREREMEKWRERDRERDRERVREREGETARERQQEREVERERERESERYNWIRGDLIAKVIEWVRLARHSTRHQAANQVIFSLPMLRRKLNFTGGKTTQRGIGKGNHVDPAPNAIP